MAVGALIPLAVFVVIAGSVGVRLVRLWRRTREAPEAALGFGLLLVALSQPICAIGRVPGVAMEPLGRIGFAAGLGLAALGIGAMVFFTYRVFRYRVAWAQGLLVAIGVLLVAGAGYASLRNFTGSSVDEIKQAMRPGTLALTGGIFVGCVWGAVESFGFRSRLRRQLTLGLADPVVADRFLLWGVASAASAVLILGITACVLTGMTILQEAVPLMLMAGCGSLMSAAWYLTFFAPEAYRRFVYRRAAAQPS